MTRGGRVKRGRRRGRPLLWLVVATLSVLAVVVIGGIVLQQGGTAGVLFEPAPQKVEMFPDRPRPGPLPEPAEPADPELPEPDPGLPEPDPKPDPLPDPLPEPLPTEPKDD